MYDHPFSQRSEAGMASQVSFSSSALRRRPGLRIGVFVFAGLLACPGLAQAYAWTVTEIGSLGGDGRTWASSINNLGQVVGSSPTASGDSHAFLYSNGVMRDLGTLGSGRSSNAASINNLGQIVGSSTTGELDLYGRALSRPFIYEAGQMRGLQAEGFASDISDNGLVAGTVSFTSGVFQAALYDSRSRTLLATGNSALEWSSAYAVNTSGQAVGAYAGEFSNNAAFSYDHNTGHVHTLDPLGRDLARAVDINEGGQATGTAFYSYGGQGYSTAFMYEDGLSTALINPFGFASSADGINNLGQIVGSYQIDGDFTGGTWHAFLYDNGQWIDLNDGLTLENGDYLYRAVALNDRGDIIAYGSDGTNYLLSRQPSLTPVPEAETWVLLLTGVVLMSMAGRRRISPVRNRTAQD